MNQITFYDTACQTHEEAMPHIVSIISGAVAAIGRLIITGNEEDLSLLDDRLWSSTKQDVFIPHTLYDPSSKEGKPPAKGSTKAKPSAQTLYKYCHALLISGEDLSTIVGAKAIINAQGLCVTSDIGQLELASNEFEKTIYIITGQNRQIARNHWKNLKQNEPTEGPSGLRLFQRSEAKWVQKL